MDDGVPVLHVAFEALDLSAARGSSPAVVPPVVLQYGSSTQCSTFFSSTRDGGSGFLQLAIEAFSRFSANLTSPLSPLQLGSSTHPL